MTLSLTFHDITNYRETGRELITRINNDMKHYADSVLTVKMPDLLTMTQKQYDDLMKLNRLDTMYHSDEQMFLTPYNVMEVRVSNRNKLTFKEVQGLDDKQFDNWEKETEGA